MKHRPRPPEQADFLRPRLVDLIDMRHTCAALAGLIDWEFSGDALFAVLCGCGHNILKILAHLRALWRSVVALIMAILIRQRDCQIICAVA